MSAVIIRKSKYGIHKLDETIKINIFSVLARWNFSFAGQSSVLVEPQPVHFQKYRWLKITVKKLNPLQIL